MCGIAGILYSPGVFSTEGLAQCLLEVRDTMVHRGPDDAGLWLDPDGGCGLAHRRLAIIDLSAEGRQPMGNADGSAQVTFNGEIYNFETLRDDLIARGHRFHSHTDTEVIPHLFESFDRRQVERLDGMFAFGVWHRPSRRLLLARDPFGKKPLYYAQGPGWFAFASELQALTRIPGFDRSIDPDALAYYLMLQYVPAPFSIYRGARKLLPGSTLVVQSRGDHFEVGEAERFFRFDPREPAAADGLALEERQEELRLRVREAVRKRLMSDVPLGAFLSGGVDSALVAAMVTQELGRPLRTFSIGFGGTTETEHQYAREVAAHLGTDHHEDILSPDALELVHEIAARLDEPNGDSSCLPTYLLSRFTREQVTVALSGDGGDEVFGGYGRYRDTLLEQESLPRRFVQSVRQRRLYNPADAYLSPRWFTLPPDQVDALTGGRPPAVAATLRSWRAALMDSSQPLMHRMRALDAETYLPGAVLPKVDRMSMQVSLEVRCPLLDRDLAEFAQGLPVSACWQPPAETKRILKRLATRYLPESWMNRRKMGFGLPSNTWSSERTLRLAHDLLLVPESRVAGLLDPDALRRLIAHQASPGCFSIYQIWPVLILELWLRRSDP
ncbi:asparagine synthase (glutamine-hydrolyzing) [Thiocapsa imhoffii]|uniref:asparagine synthase (glutamine-hydrolyzing) n=1 Tax=Thiocapsa imhoffii TaxID=382777 RepID=A0A9X0WHX4_9GAMM|nr:asparagine synthase (glutamine-hydrolyzing) [Thiocapsa imhoffii]MBK1644903.1 asparagine synthase (glutamine-hydrolyzing) [Thiocapsa imhoffii]